MTEPNPYPSPENAEPAPAAAPVAVSDDERLWGMLSHLASLLTYVSAVGQFVAPLVIYLVYKDKSRFVTFHALQSLFFQLALLVAILVVSGIGLATCGFGFLLLVPLGVAALVYNIVAAIKAFNGEWFDYWLVGNFVRRQFGFTAAP